MAYIGTDINYGNIASQTGVGNGSTTPIASLTYSVPTASSIIVTLDGVTQVPTTDYTASGTTLTFTSTVASPIAILVVFLGRSLDIGTPADNTVTNAKMANNSVDSAELVAGSVDDSHISGMASSKLSGIVPTANLGTGTASSTTVLYGDGTYKTEPVTANEITKQSSAPTISSPATPTVGDLILATSTGQMYACSVVASGANQWINIGDGTGAVLPLVAATGGTITTDGNFKIHTFTTSGTFTVSATAATGVEYLVVAGGGAGGAQHGGGGGAGGYKTATGFTVTATSFTVTIGAGATGQAHSIVGANGSNSVFSSITSTGGGGGGVYTGTYNAALGAGQAGGSGGGGASATSGAGPGPGGAAVPSGQGNAGGNGAPNGSDCGGGGGGASAVGVAGTSSAAGAGGNGTASSITGSSVTRGGGGGGGRYTAATQAAGGTGGGGAGAIGTGTLAVAGTVNTGGGGGSSGHSTHSGKNGGSGIVIIRYQYQ